MVKSSNYRPLGEAIKELLKEYQLEGKINEMKVIECWAKVTGKLITKHTKEIHIKDKKLFVQIDSPALKHELNFSKSKIVEALNAEVGLQVIEEVIFT